MNNLRGDLLDTWALTLIRNVGNARITIRNTDTQEVLQQEELGAVLAAFYVPLCRDVGQYLRAAPGEIQGRRPP